MPEPRPKRRRLLVDPELQIGLSSEMVGWIYVYFVAFAILANAGNFLTIAASRPQDAGYLAAVDELRSFARYVVLPMGLTFVAMAAHGVFLTHRIAGPIVRLKRTVREIACRRLPAPVTLRKKDHFGDLADEMNAALAVLREDAARRRRMSDDVLQATHRLLRSLENPAGDRRESLALAHGVLDAAEALSCSLATGSDAPSPGAELPVHVPLPEADLPAVSNDTTAEVDARHAAAAAAATPL